MNFWDLQSTLQCTSHGFGVMVLISQIRVKFEELFNPLYSNLMKSKNVLQNLPAHGGWSCWPWTRPGRAVEPATSCCSSDRPQGGNPGPSLLSSSHTWHNKSDNQTLPTNEQLSSFFLNKSRLYYDGTTVACQSDKWAFIRNLHGWNRRKSIPSINSNKWLPLNE